jgi:hypothetical protein
MGWNSRQKTAVNAYAAEQSTTPPKNNLIRRLVSLPNKSLPEVQEQMSTLL